MLTDRELLQDAYDALFAMQAYARENDAGLRICDEALDALRTRLEQKDDEPVGYVRADIKDAFGKYNKSNICDEKTSFYCMPVYLNPSAKQEYPPRYDINDIRDIRDTFGGSTDTE